MKSRPLTDVASGAKVRIVAVWAGRACQARLAAMGLFPGTEIEVVRSPAIMRGPFIVRKGESQLMLGWGMANQVYVTA